MKKIFNAALYVRLSREDGDGGDSDSIVNQRAMLAAFIKNDDSIVNFREYTDDGYSGTDLNRPAFTSMIADIDCGKINCVVVKDLSRLGRNYIELGRLTEVYFPQKRVRFIAINDYIDSYRSPNQSASIIVPFKNLLNDEYSRDISQKIRSALDTRRKSGAFIGSFASYGYKKDELDHSKLVVDTEAADIVRRIFALFNSGISKYAIARQLNCEGVLPPALYKKKYNPTYKAPQASENSLWSFSSVDRILKNPIYTGTMVQGKTNMLSHRIHTPIRRDESQWIVVGGTHEAIVCKNDFENAEALDLKTSRSDAPGEPHALAGLVKCADCGRSLNRRKITQSYGVYNYYFCPTYRQSKTACTKHSIRVEAVENAVLNAICDEIARAADFSALYDKYKSKPHNKDNKEANLKSIAREQAKIMDLKRSIYEDWKSGVLEKDEFTSFKSKYDSEYTRLCEEYKSIEGKSGDSKNPWLERLMQIEHPKELTRELAVCLIEQILVYSDSHICIKFKFSNSLSELEHEMGNFA